MLIVKAKVKEYAKERHDMRVSQEFLDALDGVIEELVTVAAANAKAKKIGTIKKRHLIFQHIV